MHPDSQPSRENELQAEIDMLYGAIEGWRKVEAELQDENSRLKNWIRDLQGGMSINCVYCGHRYGPNTETPVAMADVLKEHIEQCPEHPMSKLKAENERLREALAELVEVADLRGDSDLPHPADDLKLWTARMVDAWVIAREVLHEQKGGDA